MIESETASEPAESSDAPPSDSVNTEVSEAAAAVDQDTPAAESPSNINIVNKQKEETVALKCSGTMQVDLWSNTKC